MIWHFLMPHIKHLQDAGNVVECACPRRGFWFDDIKEKCGVVMHEIPFARSPYRFLQNRRAFKMLKKVVKDGGFDLIHCHQPLCGVMGRKVGAKFGIPVLYIAHGFHFFKGAPLKNHLIYKTVERRYAKKTDALVTINSEDYEAACKMKAKRTYKINGIGYERDRTNGIIFNKNELQAEIGLSDGDIVLISIGELNKNKNHKVIIDAVNRIENEKIKYVICGQGPRLKEYKEFVEKRGLENKVKILGYRKDVRNILKLADILIMPSLREGLPITMIEAMYEGLPIISGDVRGCRDLVEHNANGLLVNLKEKTGFVKAIEILAADKELRLKMGIENKQRAKKLYLENVLVQMEKIYDEILA
jgi:glycosyltransferase involved in cell wall biosynthesis